MVRRRGRAGCSEAALEPALLETERVFTRQVNLESVGLIYMNGRVYDPVFGRFRHMPPRPD